jgi:hypothetical protein
MSDLACVEAENPDDDMQITAHPLFVIKLKSDSDRTDLSYRTDKSSLTLQVKTDASAQYTIPPLIENSAGFIYCERSP